MLINLINTFTSLKSTQFACAHALPVRNEMLHGANDRLTLKSHFAHNMPRMSIQERG